MTELSDSPPTTLRERQGQRVREELQAAFVRLVVERGVDALSLHDVAEAAGISDRTLYRYYPNRDALIDDVLSEATKLVDTAQRERGVRAGSGDGLDRPDSVAGAFEVFEEHADLVRAAVRIRQSGSVDQRHESRTTAVRDHLDASGVHPEALDALATLVRMLTGADAWIRMTSPEFGLGTREAGLAAHWAVQVLIEAAAGHQGPLRPRFDDGTSAHQHDTRADRDGIDR